MIVNNYCPDCEKFTVCSWSEKLYKLEGNDKKPGILSVTVDTCEEFLEVDGQEIKE